MIGDLPTILLELDADSADYAVEKSYVYANSQILSQHDYSDSNDYFYLHDRLGSVRQIIDSNQKVEKYYQFTPFGQLQWEDSSADAPSNPWKFTGQYFDDETGQYYLRARQYSPYISRFTTHDPIMGKLEEPMTLHKYLYCGNDAVNRLDLSGRLYTPYGEGHYNSGQTQNVLDRAILFDKSVGFYGAVFAHGLSNHDSRYPWRAEFDYKDLGFSFDVGNRTLKGSEFGNYTAGYALYYNFGTSGLAAAYGGGQLYGASERGLFSPYSLSSGIGYDDWGSIYHITKGALDANKRAQAWYKDSSADLMFKPCGMESTIADNPIRRFEEKVRLRWEGLGLAGAAQMAEAMWMADGGL